MYETSLERKSIKLRAGIEKVNMKILGQPTNYSDMLQRVFYFSFATGFISTLIIAKESPYITKIIQSFKIDMSVWGIKDIKALYVLIPIFIAMISRIIKLHDRISDLFQIRLHFDMEFILKPLCKGAKVHLNSTLETKIRNKRIKSMYETFYKYAGSAGNNGPTIDAQLVYTALDNWGWFWVFIESSFLIIMTMIVLAFLQSWNYVIMFLFVFTIEFVFILYFWLMCIKSGQPQVNAILNDNNRLIQIKNYFNSL